MAERKPIFNAQVASEFGEADLADLPVYGKLAIEASRTYVPGFSDLRQKRDLEILEVKQGIRQGHEVSTLPVNVRWVRCQTPISAKPDGIKQITSKVKGYRAVEKSDEGKEWFKEKPHGAEWQADGTLRLGDTVLMVTDAKTAARNQLAKQRDTARLASTNDTSADGLLGVVGQHKGAQPSVKKLTGDKLSKDEVFAD